MRFPHSVTVIRAPLVTDGKGNTIRDWANAQETVSAAWVQPVASTEQLLNQDRVVSRWRVFLPAVADVVASDRLRYAADTFQVDGEVQTWDNGAPHHREAFLRKVTGG